MNAYSPLIQPAHDRAELLNTTATDTDPGSEFIVVTDLPRELRLLTGVPCPHTARKLVTLASNDQLALERRPDGRRWWGAWRRNLPEVAKALGMVPQQAEQPAARSIAA